MTYKVVYGAALQKALLDYYMGRITVVLTLDCADVGVCILLFVNLLKSTTKQHKFIYHINKKVREWEWKVDKLTLSQARSWLLP